MSNNNRREPQNNYPPHQQQRFPPRQRYEQGPPHPQQQHPYQGNAQFPPHYYPPPPMYPHYNEEQMRHSFNQQPMPNPYFYPQFAPYPLQYTNFQHPYPYAHQQPVQNQQKNTPQRRNYQEKTVQQKLQKSSEQRQRINYPQRRQYDNRSDRNDRKDRYQQKSQHRSDRNYQPKQTKNESPRVVRLSRQEQSDKKQQQSYYYSPDSNQSSNDSESEEVIYRRKAIAKKKDPVLDSKEQIRKWIQARKRNYPKSTSKPQEAQSRVEQSQISILQKKIRKKILLINSDPKSMMKKQKDIDILRRFILYSRKPRKNLPFPAKRFDKPQPEEVKQSLQSLPVVEEERVEAEQVPIINKPQNIMIQEQGEQAVQQPIKNENKQRILQPRERQYGRRQQLSVDVIIKHLQMKQAEDTKTLDSLMDYKSNSFHYRYQHQTLETNLLLQNIFAETSYILQAIRYIVKNNFFDQTTPKEQ